KTGRLNKGRLCVSNILRGVSVAVCRSIWIHCASGSNSDHRNMGLEVGGFNCIDTASFRADLHQCCPHYPDVNSGSTGPLETSDSSAVSQYRCRPSCRVAELV